jgi:RNA polymerase sigma-70 factor (ECF subfamily)
MRSGPKNSLVQHLRRAVLLQDGAGLTDGELLQAFVARHDEACFEALVRRHGPMVLGVCHRVLRDPHDTEDAFQATFLVLVQRAASVIPSEFVGNWLYGVAYRTALEVRRRVLRRRARERQVEDMPELLVQGQETGQELLAVLDRELDRLPVKYRTAIVLCHLEGRTRKEAASQLGLPVGTLSGRLTTAIRLLAKRMGRYGPAFSGTTVATMLSSSTASAGVPVSLIASTLHTGMLAVAGQAAAGVVSAKITALAKGVLQSMFLAKLKVTAIALLTITAIGGGAGAFTYRTLAAALPGAPSARGQESDRESDIEGKEEPNQAVPNADQKLDTEKSDKARLQGTWIPVGGEVDGLKKSSKDPKLVQWTLIFDGDRVTLPGDEKVPYALDPTQQPKEMDIKVKGKKIPMKAIYQFEGATLKLSWKKDGGRPSDFDTGKNEGVLIVFERRMTP